MQFGQSASLNVTKARLQISPQSPAGQVLFDIIPIRRDAPNAVVVLEFKGGGQPDEAAVPLEEFRNSVVSVNAPINQRGFIRLRLAEICADPAGAGVAMSIHCNSPIGM